MPVPSQTSERSCIYVLVVSMPVPSQTSERSCIYVLVVSMPVPSQTSERSCIYVLVISMPVPSQTSERSCIYVFRISNVLLYTIFIFYFRIIPAVWYFFPILLLYSVDLFEFLKQGSNVNLILFSGQYFV
jgi:hypothetical protein